MTGAARNGQPFDLDLAAKAARAEANPVPFQFTYRGQAYQVPPAIDWPLQAQALIGEGELEQALVMLMGQEVYDGLVAQGITMGELSALFEAVGEQATGGGLGNSSGPAKPALQTQT